MAASSDVADLDEIDFDLTTDTLKERIKQALARARRMALARRKLLLEELAIIEGEYDLPRTKPSRHREH